MLFLIFFICDTRGELSPLCLGEKGFPGRRNGGVALIYRYDLLFICMIYLPGLSELDILGRYDSPVQDVELVSYEIVLGFCRGYDRIVGVGDSCAET